MHSEHLSGWYGPAFPNAESVLPSSVLSTFFLDREVKARNPFALFDSLVGSAFLAVLVVCTWSMTRPQSHLLIFFEHFRSRRSWVMIKQSCCVVLEGGRCWRCFGVEFFSHFVMSDKSWREPDRGVQMVTVNLTFSSDFSDCLTHSTSLTGRI